MVVAVQSAVVAETLVVVVEEEVEVEEVGRKANLHYYGQTLAMATVYLFEEEAGVSNLAASCDQGCELGAFGMVEAATAQMDGMVGVAGETAVVGLVADWLVAVDRDLLVGEVVVVVELGNPIVGLEDLARRQPGKNGD